MSDRPAILKLDAGDAVGVALRDLSPGERLTGHGVTVRQQVPRAHKVALQDIGQGDPVHKFGHPIGLAGENIAAGAHVHVHNLRAELTPGEHAGAPHNAPWAVTDRTSCFAGFRRGDGRAGTRNYVGIIATVNCSATVVRKIVERFSDTELAGLNNVDGIVPITHSSGCGMAAEGEGHEVLRRTLRGFIEHPNFGGVLVIGLGCEVNEVGHLLDAEPPLVRGATLRAMTIQEAGGTGEAIAAGEAHVRELLRLADRSRRERVPASELTVGLQCGGSDAYSGVSANPALGIAADLLVRAGGTVILAETPEICGAEHLLLRRAESEAVAARLRARLAWWREYVKRHGASLNNNPTPGNLAGGISTIFEKSLGAVAKAGSSPLRGVALYGQRVPARGLVFMDSPGYDPCSVTGEIAAGANLICFTTGRGSVFGARPAPSLKLGTHSELARRMAGDVDFDCGPVIGGGLSLEEAGKRIFALILETASGKASKSELSGFGDLEFVPWQIGAVL